MRYVDQGLIVHDKAGPSAWFRLSTRRQELLSYAEWERLTNAEVQRLAALTGYDGQIVGVNRAYSVEDWTGKLIAVTPQWNPGFADELQRTADRLGDYSSGKEVYLGVRLVQDQQAPDWRKRLGLGMERWLNIEDPRPTADQLDEFNRLRDRAGRRVQAGGLGARPATAEELRWLIRRTFWRSLVMPLGEPNRPAWGGEAYELLAGAHVNNGIHYLHVRRRDGQEFWVAVVGFAHLPDQLGDGREGDMTANWLHLQDELPFPVEFQVRFRVLPRGEAIKAVEAVTSRVRGQYDHIRELPEATIPRALEEQHLQTDDIEHAVKVLRQTIIQTWPRLIVAAPTEAEIQDRIQQVVDHLHDELETTVEVAPAPRRLFRECIPGYPFDQTNHLIYPQEMELKTLAGSGMLTATSLGDETGPYQGVTTANNTPVHLDPHRASRVNKPTLIVVAGTLGSGKSVWTMKNVWWDRMRHASASWLAPEGCPEGFLELCRREGNVFEVRLDDDADKHASELISLDPFRFLAPDYAGQLSASLCQTMLPQGHSPDIDMAIDAAAGDVADLLKNEGSLLKVIDHLGTDPEYRDIPGVVAASRVLRNMARQPISRALFRESDRQLDLYDALTVLRFQGLQLPAVNVARADWSVEQRVSTAVMQSMIALQSCLSDIGGVNHPKIAVYDDCHPVLINPFGRAVVNAMVLRGRKKHETPVLATQNVSHLFSDSEADENTLISNCGIAVVFRLPDEKEARAGCRLLKIEPTIENIRHIQTLGPNHEEGKPVPFSVCLIRDLEDNVGEVQIDLERDSIRAALSTTPGLEVIAAA